MGNTKKFLMASVIVAVVLAGCGLDGAITGSQKPAPDTAQKSQNILVCQDSKTTTVTNTTNQTCDKHNDSHNVAGSEPAE